MGGRHSWEICPAFVFPSGTNEHISTGDRFHVEHFFPTAESSGVSAQIGSGVVCGRFQGGFRRVQGGLGIPPRLTFFLSKWKL